MTFESFLRDYGAWLLKSTVSATGERVSIEAEATVT